MFHHTHPQEVSLLLPEPHATAWRHKVAPADDDDDVVSRTMSGASAEPLVGVLLLTLTTQTLRPAFSLSRSAIRGVCCVYSIIGCNSSRSARRNQRGCGMNQFCGNDYYCVLLSDQPANQKEHTFKHTFRNCQCGATVLFCGPIQSTKSAQSYA